jgi:hypothetical protein
MISKSWQKPVYFQSSFHSVIHPLPIAYKLLCHLQLRNPIRNWVFPANGKRSKLSRAAHSVRCIRNLNTLGFKTPISYCVLVHSSHYIIAYTNSQYIDLPNPVYIAGIAPALRLQANIAPGDHHAYVVSLFLERSVSANHYTTSSRSMAHVLLMGTRTVHLQIREQGYKT